MRIGYLECFSGISGDMLLGALVDAGVPVSLFEETTAALNVGARIEMRKVLRGGIAGTKVDVITPETPANAAHDHGQDQAHNHDHDHADHHDHHHHHDHDAGHHHHHDHEHNHAHAPHRSLSAILKVIRSAPLAECVKDRASRAFQLLGEAEARMHSIPIENVHFHEVGAVDTIVDIVCAAAGCESLSVDRWMASPLNVGSGTVECAHGTLPVPAPATLALLADAPIYSSGIAMERVTPTGAAMLRALDVSYCAIPPMRVRAQGYGAGGRDTPGTPNLLRLLIGEALEQSDAQSDAQSDTPPAALESKPEPQPEQIAVTEAVIDDSTPQLLAYVSELLLEAGAWDVYRMPVQMKKGRSGVQITVLSSPDSAAALRDLLLRETTTIGLRWRTENKLALAREFAEVETPWGKVRIKVARWPGGDVSNAAPEYEDCRTLARRHSVPLKRVMQEAMRAWSNLPQG